MKQGFEYQSRSYRSLSAIAHRACEYLQKPMDIAAYKEVVRSMIQKWAIGKKETDEAVS
jgi:hypothetical protein